MATKISYLNVENKMGETWNPVVGCTKCSPGCLNCYAEKMMYRQVVMGCARHEKNPDSNEDAWIAYSGVMDEDTHKWNGEVALRYDQLDAPLHWRKPRRILCCSMGDLFHEKVPFEFIDKVFATMALCPQHTFLVLTKRVARMLQYCGDEYRWAKHILPEIDKLHSPWQSPVRYFWPQPHIHLGATICNQKEADEKIPILLQIPAAHRFLSIEPMLGPIDFEFLTEHTGSNEEMKRPLIMWDLKNGLDWVVVGCESGPKRRPCKLEWIRSIVEQCKAAGVKCYVKQIPINGKVEKDISKFPEYLQVRDKM